MLVFLICMRVMLFLLSENHLLTLPAAWAWRTLLTREGDGAVPSPVVLTPCGEEERLWTPSRHWGLSPRKRKTQNLVLLEINTLFKPK